MSAVFPQATLPPKVFHCRAFLSTKDLDRKVLARHCIGPAAVLVQMRAVLLLTLVTFSLFGGNMAEPMDADSGLLHDDVATPHAAADHLLHDEVTTPRSADNQSWRHPFISPV